MEQTITGAFGDLRIETELVDVTSNLPRPDTNWRYTDTQGHEHYWDQGYPTLVKVVDETYWCHDCGDWHEVSHLECPHCGETIEPGMLGPPGHREYAPGRTSYTLNGEPITPDRAQQIIDEATS